MKVEDWVIQATIHAAVGKPYPECLGRSEGRLWVYYDEIRVRNSGTWGNKKVTVQFLCKDRVVGTMDVEGVEMGLATLQLDGIEGRTEVIVGENKR